MVRDSRKSLEFSHNALNLPMTASSLAGSTVTNTMTYTYLGDGTRVGARVSNPDAQGYSGMRYRGSFVYDVADTGEQTLESIAVSTGRLIALTGTNGSVSFESDGFITDHLGNVAAVVNLSAPASTSNANVILEQDEYYPFGTKMEAAGMKTQATNRYRYAGKEEQDIAGMDLGLLDFGARYYDSYVGRWNAIDPLAHKYFGMSPYNYCGNDPVNRFDPDGKTDYYSKNGELIYNDGVDDGIIYISTDTSVEQYKTSNDVSDLSNNAIKADGLIIVNRNINNDDYTSGDFEAVGDNGFSGYTLERGGNPSTESGKCLPIPDGLYNTKPREEMISRHFAFRIWNDNVSIKRGILGNIGNTTSDSTGCILFGLRQGSNSSTIQNSGNAMDKFENYFSGKSNVYLIVNKCY